MFNFLSIFKKNNDEELNDNEYDFKEMPSAGVDVLGEIGSEKPALTDSAFGGQQERPVPPMPPIMRAISELADQAKADAVRDQLDDISDSQPKSLSASSQEGKSPFDVSDLDHRRVKRFKPEFVGKGGENLVYTLPDHPDIVVKAEMEPLMKQIEAANDEHRPITNKLTTQQREELREQLAVENTSNNELLTYFGEDHVLHTSKAMLKVPLSKDVLEAVYTEKRIPVPDFTLAADEMWTIVAIQEKVPQIGDDKSLDVRGGFAELRNPEAMGDIDRYKQAYENATQSLVCDPESASFDLDQFLVIHPDLRAIVTQADANPQLKDSLKDFVLKGMEYTKQTGKTLDLAGAKNILFFENSDSSWNYKLVDALSPHAEEALERTKELMEKVVAKESLVDGEPFAIISAVNYIRTMNGLAKHLGIEEHIDMPQGSNIAPSELWDVLYQGPPQEIPNQEQEATSETDDHEKKKLSRAALAESLESFAILRGRELSQLDSSIDEAELKALGLENIRQNYSLLEDLDREGSEDKKAEPICTICIPVAILKEDDEVVAHTVSLIKEAQKRSGEPVEIVLWMNAKYKDPNEEKSTQQEAQERYDTLKGRLQSFAGEGLRIQTALQVSPIEQGTISKMRSNYMDAIALQGVERGYGFEHPILWMDADTTFMANNTIADMSTSIKNFNELFVHANTQFSAEWGTGKPLAELDDATKAVVIHEIQRRQHARRVIGNAGKWRYYEESGLGFALGTYLKAGGIDTTEPASESATLMKRAFDVNEDINDKNFEAPVSDSAMEEIIACRARWNSQIKDASRRLDMDAVEKAEAGYREEYTKILLKQPIDRSIAPHFLLPDDGTLPGGIKYIKSARLGTSGRRHYALASESGAAALNNVDINYSDAGLFADMETGDEGVDSNQASITKDDMLTLADKEALRFHNNVDIKNWNSPKEKPDRKIIDNMINKYFEKKQSL